jgi:5-methyltetrahydrofolate--homocysteine methyltransferase
MQNIIPQIYTAVLEGDANAVKELVQQGIEEGLEAQTMLNEGLIAAMNEVGRLFEEGEYFVPEMLVSARAMQAGMNLLRPILVEQDVKPMGRVVIGTVKGDLHDIGKNLVGMMLEGAGFEVIDLGMDVPEEKFLRAIEEHQPHLVGLSALLTTTMGNMKTTIEAIKAAGLRERVKIMLGGAPVTQTFAAQIGADGYAPDASQAVTLAKRLMGAAV